MLIGVLAFLLLLFATSCFSQPEPRVYWNAADRNEFPWMARLQANFRSRRSKVCSATLVSPLWLLTSAHCVQNDESLEIANSVIATLGRYDVKKSFEPGQIQRSSSQILIHPLYNRFKYWDYDFALIKLKQPANTSAVAPISMPFTVSFCSANYTNITQPVDSCATAIALGWTKDTDELTNILQKASVDVQSFSYCEQTGRVPIDTFSQVRICAPANSGNTRCLGDSGGPLICKLRDQLYYLIGVTSYGPLECNIADREIAPNIHSRICPILPWLQSNIEGKKISNSVASCGTLPWVYNGFLSKGKSSEGSVRNITCFEGLQLIGAGSIICTAQGSWTTPGFCIT